MNAPTSVDRVDAVAPARAVTAPTTPTGRSDDARRAATRERATPGRVGAPARPGVVRVALAVAISCAAAVAAAQGSAVPAQNAAAPAAPATPGVPAAPADARPWTDRAFANGVVAVSHPAAAAAGALMLARGGNAVDAAAAIQFALNVVEPQFSGIGGGGFMMIHLAKTGETVIVDSRERAPAAATPDMFQLAGVPAADRFGVASTSGLAVGVPGTLLGVDTALRRWGTVSLAESLLPAIALAERGFEVNRFLARDIANDGGRTALQPETAAIFRPNGRPLAEGDTLRQPDLARTFRRIARDGVRAFYEGEIAQAIVDAQRRTRTTGPGQVPAQGQGRMTLDDLRGYQVAIRQPIVGRYRGWTVASMPPPSSGGLTVLQMLGMLERFPIGDRGAGFGFGSAQTWHVMTEAMRLAFADRAVWMGDEDFVPVPKRGLLAQPYVAQRSRMIALDRRMPTPGAGDPRPYDTGPLAALSTVPGQEPKGVHTTHFSVVDREGNVVSYTTTIENTWGTGIVVPGWGFLLNNELTDFNFDPTRDAATGNPGANDVAPGKRPRSSMSPTMLFRDGKPFAAYGSPGGATIINSVLNVTMNLIDHGFTIQQAIDAPRLSVTGAAGAISCEGTEPFMRPQVPASTLDALRALGHAVPATGCTSTIGSVQGVVIDLRTGRQYGGADARREGTVIGLPDWRELLGAFGGRTPAGIGR